MGQDTPNERARRDRDYYRTAFERLRSLVNRLVEVGSGNLGITKQLIAIVEGKNEVEGTEEVTPSVSTLHDCTNCKMMTTDPAGYPHPCSGGAHAWVPRSSEAEPPYHHAPCARCGCLWESHPGEKACERYQQPRPNEPVHTSRCEHGACTSDCPRLAWSRAQRTNEAKREHRFVFESPNCTGCGEHTSRAIGECPGPRTDEARPADGFDPEHCPTCKAFADRNRPPGPKVEVKSELWDSAKLKMRQLESEIHASSATQAQKSNMLHSFSKLCMFASDAWDMHVIRPAQRSETAVVWADEASPFTGAQVKALLWENETLRSLVVLAAKIGDEGEGLIDFDEAVHQAKERGLVLETGSTDRG